MGGGWKGGQDTADFVDMYDKMGDNEDEGTRFFPLLPTDRLTENGRN